METSQQDKAKGTAILIVVTLVSLLGLFYIPKILKSFSDGLSNLGIGKTEDEKNKINLGAIARAQSYFSPNFYRQIPKGYTHARVKYKSAVKTLANQIKNSVGLIYDNPEKMAGAFSEIKNKVQVSQLSEYFNQNFGIGLYEFMYSKMDRNSQVQIFNEIIERLNKLPLGWVNPSKKMEI